MNAQRRRRPLPATSMTYAAYRRRGVALLIVLALLGLFAAVGVSFAVLSRAESRGAANFKRGISIGKSIPPADLFRNAVNQLLSDTTNPQSALRGHSLLRDMYGGPDTDTGTTATGPTGVGNGVGAENRLVSDAGATPPWTAAMNSGHFGVRTGDPRGRIPYWGAFNGTGLFGPRKQYAANGAVGGKVTNGVLDTNEAVIPYLMVTPPRDFGNISPEYWNDFGLTPSVRIFPFLPYNYSVFPNRGATGGPGTRYYGGLTSVGLDEYPSPEKFRRLGKTDNLGEGFWSTPTGATFYSPIVCRDELPVQSRVDKARVNSG